MTSQPSAFIRRIAGGAGLFDRVCGGDYAQQFGLAGEEQRRFAVLGEALRLLADGGDVDAQFLHIRAAAAVAGPAVDYAADALAP